MSSNIFILCCVRIISNTIMEIRHHAGNADRFFQVGFNPEYFWFWLLIKQVLHFLKQNLGLIERHVRDT